MSAHNQVTADIIDQKDTIPRFQSASGILVWILLLAGVLLSASAVWEITSAWSQNTLRLPVTLSPEAVDKLLDHQPAVEGLPGFVRSGPEPTSFVMEFWKDTSIPLKLLSLLPDVIVKLSLVGGAILLGQLLQTIGRLQPFTRANQRRLYGIAALIALGTYGAEAAQWLATNIILFQLGSGYGDLGPDSFHGPDHGWPPLIAVLVTAIMSDVIRKGRRLQSSLASLVQPPAAAEGPEGPESIDPR